MRFEELVVLLLIAVPLIWLIGFVTLFLVKVNGGRKVISRKQPQSPAEEYEKISLDNGGKHNNDGKTDERAFEIGDSEIDRPIIDTDSRLYYQNLGDKLRQDENAEMLSKITDDKVVEKKMNFNSSKAGEQAKQRQIEREARNQRMLDKLKGYRIKRKIAKKAAKKNIQLDEKMIEKIKLRALSGKMR